MPPTRRKKWILGSCIGFALVTVIAGLWATRSHALLDHATRITENNFVSYAWKSADTLILVFPGTAPDQSYVERNIKTGAQQLGTFHGTTGTSSGWRPSPNGLRLLTAGPSGEYYVVGLRETERYQREFGESTYADQTSHPPGVAWLPDNSRWLAWFPKGGKEALRLFSVDAPRNAAVTIPAPNGMTGLLGITPDQLVVQSDAPLPPIAVGKVTIATFGVYPNRTPVKAIPISLPTTAQVKELELAPQGDRLAWMFVDARRSPLITMIVRMLPSLASRFPLTQGTSLWVSRRDGTEMTEIGFEQTLTTAKQNNVPGDMRWLPDGKRLSFTMNNALYTISTP